MMLHGDLLGLASQLMADPLLTRKRLAVLADLVDHGRRSGWSDARIVDELGLELRLSPMAAHRLFWCLTGQEAVATIAGLAEEEGVTVRITVDDLRAWENEQAPVPLVLVNAVCEAYRTHPNRIGVSRPPTP
jgi:hypothetical protein